MLKIRCFYDKWCICAGVGPEGEGGEGFYIGHIFSWHNSFEEAKAERDLLIKSL